MLKKTTECPYGAGTGPKAPTWKPTDASPERLVGMGFRCWLAGYQTGDIECWELAWRQYSEVLGLTSAKLALGELSCWVRAVRDAARRPINIYPASCRGFCRDESMAISLIAACQQNACPAARACAFALLGDTLVDEPLETAQAFGARLESLGQRLSAAPIYVEGPAPRGGEAAYHA